MRSLALGALLLLGAGCATATVVGPPLVPMELDSTTQRAVILEPFFELADWQTQTRTDYARVSPGLLSSGFGVGGLMGSSDVAITRQVQVKPLFARVPALMEQHRLLLMAVQRLRPGWRVTSTSGTSALGDSSATLVRVLIENNETVESNRTLKNMCFVFGLVLLPLQFVHIYPVEETVRVYGQLHRYQTPANALVSRLVKYPSQADYAINVVGLPAPLQRDFGIDVTYDEGLFANEAPREHVLVEGFVDRLARAVVALVEEQR